MTNANISPRSAWHPLFGRPLPLPENPDEVLNGFWTFKTWQLRKVWNAWQERLPLCERYHLQDEDETVHLLLRDECWSLDDVSVAAQYSAHAAAIAHLWPNSGRRWFALPEIYRQPRCIIGRGGRLIRVHLDGEPLAKPVPAPFARRPVDGAFLLQAEEIQPSDIA
jgi:hypothetical protein